MAREWKRTGKEDEIEGGRERQAVWTKRSQGLEASFRIESVYVGKRVG